MAHFHFVTNGMYDAPIDPVWKIITDVERLPEWWPGFKKATLRGTDRTLRVGQIVDCVLQAPMGYALTFVLQITDLTPPTLMRLQSSGDLVGWGQWDLRPEGDRTAVSYTWDVTLTKPLFSALTRLPFVRGLLNRNHEIVMSKGFESLRQLLRKEAQQPGAS